MTFTLCGGEFCAGVPVGAVLRVVQGMDLVVPCALNAPAWIDIIDELLFRRYRDDYGLRQA